MVCKLLTWRGGAGGFACVVLIEMKSDPLITYRRKPATLDAESLQSFAEVLRARVARGREFHCRITNDAELQSLNAQFLGKNYATDVLSFPSPISPSPTSPWPIS